MSTPVRNQGKLYLDDVPKDIAVKSIGSGEYAQAAANHVWNGVLWVPQLAAVDGSMMVSPIGNIEVLNRTTNLANGARHTSPGMQRFGYNLLSGFIKCSNTVILQIRHGNDAAFGAGTYYFKEWTVAPSTDGTNIRSGLFGSYVQIDILNDSGSDTTTARWHFEMEAHSL